jgi:tRNA G18 (ribose-2'-O)-methylase SpoU
MVDYKFVQCENIACQLRMPIDVDQFSGKYCPRCGELMQIVTDSQPIKAVDKKSTEVKRTITVVLDNIRSAYNVGSIFRTSDGLGVKKLYLCGITPTPKEMDALRKTALGAENTIPWEYHSNGLNITKKFKDQGYHLIALERTTSSLFINDFRPDPSDQRVIALILGNEKAGIDPGIIALCDEVIALPMMGKKASLNVAVAFGAAAYWLSFI